MASQHTELVYEEIEKAMAVAQRELKRGVLPKDVQARLPYRRAEGSVRRDMGDMARIGRLVRLGGTGARQGYRLPTRMERICWGFMQMFPVGTEKVSVEQVKIALRRDRK